MTLPERYVQLALALGRHEPELVEFFYGPPELAAEVEAEELREPAQLADEADVLLEELGTAELEPARSRWFRAQLRSLLTTAQRLDGAELPYGQQVERTFEITPRWYDEDEYRHAHELLDAALPGNGDLGSRFGAWLEQTTLPAETVVPALRAGVAELRRRTQALVGLPAGEEIELEGVRNKRWFGFNRPLGGLKSRISVNLDRPFPAADLLWFLAHEGYPGHHVEGVWKEQVLWRERGQAEQTITLLGVPDGVIAEGIAEVGPDLVLEEDGQEVTAKILRGLGVDHDVEVAVEVGKARTILTTVRSNAALLVFDRGASHEEALAYVREWGLLPDDRARTQVQSVVTQPFPGYAHCYPEGKRLCVAFVHGDAERFKRLLTTQLTPAEISSAAA